MIPDVEDGDLRFDDGCYDDGEDLWEMKQELKDFDSQYLNTVQPGKTLAPADYLYDPQRKSHEP